MTENWLPAAGWEDVAEVSDLGGIRTIDRWIHLSDGRTYLVPAKERVLSPSPKGYIRVSLARDGARKSVAVHRLVLETFVGPCPSGMEALHENDVKHDNRLANLRWSTHRDNMADSVRNGTHAESRKTHCDKGHPFSGENLGFTAGRRTCRTCQCDATKIWRARKQKVPA